MTQIVYSAQIVALLVCVYMTFRARHALNGLGRGLTLLFFLLIARRVDDVLGYLDDTGIMILSSAVVIVVTYDIFQIYKARNVYAAHLHNRQERIKDLESMKTWH